MSTPEILIVAEGEWYGVCRLPRLFHRAGVRVNLLVLPRALARRTRFAHALPLEAYGVAEIVPALRAHLQQHPDRYRWIIPGDDMTLRALAAEPERDWLRPWFPVEPTPEKLSLINSKAALVAACQAAGLPAPASIYCTDLESALAAARTIGYPVFLKGEESSSGSGVGRAADEAELRALAHTLPTHFLRQCSIQKAVSGPVGSTAVLAWQGRAIQWAGAYKRACWPAPYGASSVKEFMRHPDIELLARGVARLTGFHGFFGIDWVQCAETGRCHVIEMNPRPILQFHMAERDGVDFSVGLRHLLCGGPPPPPQPARVHPGRHPMFPQYLFRCADRRDLLGFTGWLLHGLRGRSDIPWDNRSLALGMLKKLGRHCRRRLSRRTPAQR